MEEVKDPFGYCAALPPRWRPLEFRNPKPGENYLTTAGEVRVKGKSKSNRKPRLILELMDELDWHGSRERRSQAIVMIMGDRMNVCGAVVGPVARSVVEPW